MNERLTKSVLPVCLLALSLSLGCAGWFGAPSAIVGTDECPEPTWAALGQFAHILALDYNGRENLEPGLVLPAVEREGFGSHAEETSIRELEVWLGDIVRHCEVQGARLE